MGTWGPHIFDNDVAADWLAGLTKSDVRPVEAALDALLDSEPENMFDADLATRALGAAHVVAEQAAAGTDGFDALRGKAQMAVMVSAGTASELSVLWQEAGVEAHEEWLDILRTLNAQITGDQHVTPHEKLVDVPQGQMLEAIETRLRGIDADIQSLRADLADEFKKLRRFIKEQSA